MPDPSIHTDASQQQALLVTLSWGDPTYPSAYPLASPEGGVARLTDWAAGVRVGGLVYTPLEAIRVEGIETDGGAEDRPFRLTMPSSIEPFASIARSRPTIECAIALCNPDAPTGDGSEEIARGVLESWINAPRGRAGVVEATFAGVKSLLTKLTGVDASPTCSWSLGDAQCGVDLSAYTFRGVATAVAGRTITAPVLNTTPTVGSVTLPAGWARWGRARRGGLSIPIIDHSGSVATLRWEPPSLWAGALVDFVAGCDKSIEVCRARFANEQRFGGFGSAIPAYQPLVQDRP